MKDRQINLKSFLVQYGTREACLEEITRQKYPNGIECSRCREITQHYQLHTRNAYICKKCGKQTFILQGTIFAGTQTPLPLWFYAMFVLIKTRLRDQRDVTGARNRRKLPYGMEYAPHPPPNHAG